MAASLAAISEAGPSEEATAMGVARATGSRARRIEEVFILGDGF